MDTRLQSRSGLNIGIEPSLLPFVQAAAAHMYVIPPTGQDVVLMEHTDQAARVLGVTTLPQSPGNILVGWVWNTGPLDPVNDLNLHFIDELGNDIFIGGVFLNAPVFPLVFVELSGGAGLNWSFFCLAPGEKIVARFGPLGT